MFDAVLTRLFGPKEDRSLNTILTRIFGSKSERDLKKMDEVVRLINETEPEMRGLSDAQLREETPKFRQQLENGRTLDDILPRAFAVVREVSRRNLNMRHFDVQLKGGIVLHHGKIAEMKTGEGKTLVATLPAYLNALDGKGVHVVTVNDYLAGRDSEWMGRIYRALGLTVGCIQHPLTDDQRQTAYSADITYGTNNEFGFDYLRDNMKYDLADCVQRGFNYAIVDEVDSILIDEARTPLIISGPAEESTDKYYKINRIVPNLRRDLDFQVDEKARTVNLTEEGVEKAEKLLGVGDLFKPQNMDWVHHIYQALKAHLLFKRDADYMVKDGEVVIVDEFTGRLMPGRRYSDGLHQALEAKENVRIERENQTLATITFQNYFRMYQKLAGMTGTAETEAEEFYKIYKLEVTVIPTNKRLIRLSDPDVIYRTEREKYEQVVNEIEELNKRGQPVLVGTVSIEKSEKLSALLNRRGVKKHVVLNAKYHAKEAEIVAQAGRKGAVTIATNMAGRGTDILLGGNPEFLLRQDLRDRKVDQSTLPAQENERLRRHWDEVCQAEHDEVVRLGGLRIVGTERHEARRIDNQLRGRSGRQGDPGSSRFYLSLEDDLMRIFASDRLSGIMQSIGMTEGVPIESKLITRQIERAQKQVEARNFELRKHLLEYDDVMNKQREAIYAIRRELLEGIEQRDYILELAEEILEEQLDGFAGRGREISDLFRTAKNIRTLMDQLEKCGPNESKIKDLLATAQEYRSLTRSGYPPDQCTAFLTQHARISGELLRSVQAVAKEVRAGKPYAEAAGRYPDISPEIGPVLEPLLADPERAPAGDEDLSAAIMDLVIRDVLRENKQGHSLPEALGKHPDVFSQSAVMTVKASEVTATLVEQARIPADALQAAAAVQNLVIMLDKAAGDGKLKDLFAVTMDMRRLARSDSSVDEVLEVLSPHARIPARLLPAVQGVLKDVRGGRHFPDIAHNYPDISGQFSPLVETLVAEPNKVDRKADKLSASLLSLMVQDIVSESGRGRSFSEALGKYADVFPPTYIRMAQAGEEIAGFIEEARISEESLLCIQDVLDEGKGTRPQPRRPRERADASAPREPDQSEAEADSEAGEESVAEEKQDFGEQFGSILHVLVGNPKDFICEELKDKEKLGSRVLSLVIENVLKEAVEQKSFYEAIKKYPSVFLKDYVETVEASDGLRISIDNQFGFKIENLECNPDDVTNEDLKSALSSTIRQVYEDKEKQAGAGIVRAYERWYMLQVLDAQWKDHLWALDHLKEGIGLRGYGQRDPLIEYKKESYDMFQDLNTRMGEETVRLLYHAKFPTREEIQAHEREQEEARRRQMSQHNLVFGGGDGSSIAPQKRQGPKPGRNDLCPCGSGKKTKKCHPAYLNP